MYVWSPWNILWFCWMIMCLRAVCIRWFRYVIIFPNKSAILSSFHSRITDKFKNSNTIFDVYGNSSHMKPKQNCRLLNEICAPKIHAGFIFMSIIKTWKWNSLGETKQKNIPNSEWIIRLFVFIYAARVHAIYMVAHDNTGAEKNPGEQRIFTQ